MKNFCGRCGSPIDQTTGLCPKCSGAGVGRQPGSGFNSNANAGFNPGSGAGGYMSGNANFYPYTNANANILPYGNGEKSRKKDKKAQKNAAPNVNAYGYYQNYQSYQNYSPTAEKKSNKKKILAIVIPIAVVVIAAVTVILLGLFGVIDIPFLGSATEETTEEASNAAKNEAAAGDWRNDYIDYVNNFNFDTEDEGTKKLYSLIDINGDDIPELSICRKYDEYFSNYNVCTYTNGKVVSITDGMIMSFIEGENKILFNTAMDGDDIRIYSIQNGNFVLSEEGVSNNDDVTPVYEWNGEKLNSKEEFNNKLNSAFDASKATDVAGGINKEEIIEAIKAY